MLKPLMLCYNYIMRNILKFTLIFLILIIGIGVYLFSKNPNVPATPIVDEVKSEEMEKITIEPQTIYPGDPVFITIISSSTPKEIWWNDQKLSIFEYKNKSRAFTAIDFDEKDLNKELKVVFDSGKTEIVKATITPREKIERPLGIPEKLGGNTPESAKQLISNLAAENYILNTVKTATSTLWTESFRYPLANIFVTDDYGYDRKTVEQTIAHKGTDFRAAIGTPVMAMNEGVVRIAREFTVYGNTAIVDHGLGVQTLYMHLSKLNVEEGDTVKPGQVIGLSGDTGYADAAHLHISVKIDTVSIDPMTFLGFFTDN